MRKSTMRALRPNESTHDEACANARVLSRMCSVPGAGMTRIRFKEYISVPFALVPWRALLAFADAKVDTRHGRARCASHELVVH